MASLDVNKLTEDMMARMKPILGEHWQRVQQYVKEESAKLALTVAKIEIQRATGAISEQQANTLFEMQKNASLAVLAVSAGIGDMAAAKAFSVALAELKDPINKALGFDLL